MGLEEVKFAVEALLFASERPLHVEDIKEALEGAADTREIQDLLDRLKNDYESQSRGFRLMELAGGYQLVTDERFAELLKRFYQSREKKRLSQASLETLSVVAYRQPVTRADIEFIRGVNVDGALKTLLEKGLVRVAGRKEVPGRPMLYGTTNEFLEHFGLNSLKDLPALKEYTEKDLSENLLSPEVREELQNTQEVKDERE
ncbi:MAG: SMC-Scp complex subunit ScpB [Candidatus Omnitrophota bacterium]